MKQRLGLRNGFSSIGLPLSAYSPYALEAFAADGHGDVKALKGALKGRCRLRIGKWRVFFSLDQPGNVAVTGVDNRGQAY